ncbi:MAG TPA: hypothetical protein VMY42_25230 [Thermoguttaceae bacterium]|nr:hypothetical protein [Thermoguttaceae bacterium]
MNSFNVLGTTAVGCVQRTNRNMPWCVARTLPTVLLLTAAIASCGAPARAIDYEKAVAEAKYKDDYARKLLAKGAAALPEAIEGTTHLHDFRYACMDVLTLMGESAHPTIKRLLAYDDGVSSEDRQRRFQRMDMISTLEQMGYLGSPMAGELREIARRENDFVAFTAVETLVHVGSDRPEAAKLLCEVFERGVEVPSLANLSEPFRVLGPDAAPAIVPLKQYLKAHPDQQWSDWDIAALCRVGPAAAPLAPEVLAWLEKVDRSPSLEFPIRFFASLGPEAKPYLAEVQKAVMAKNPQADEVLRCRLMVACVEGRPASIVPELKEIAPICLDENHPQHVRLGAQGVNLAFISWCTEMIAYHHPQVAAQLVPVLARGIKARQFTSISTKVLSEMAPWAGGGFDAVLEVLETGPTPEYSFSPWDFKPVVRASGELARYDPRILAALEKLAESDPYLEIRVEAMKAVAYAKALGPKSVVAVPKPEPPPVSPPPSVPEPPPGSPATPVRPPEPPTTPVRPPEVSAQPGTAADAIPGYEVLSHTKTETTLQAKVLVETPGGRLPTDGQLQEIWQRLSKYTPLELRIFFYAPKMDPRRSCWAVVGPDETGGLQVRRFDDRLPEGQ